MAIDPKNIDLQGMVSAGNIHRAPVSVPNVGSGQSDDLLKMIIQNITQPHQQLAQPVPAPIPQPHTGQMVQGRGTGFQNLMTGVSGFIQNSVAQNKQQQLAKAEADWNALTSAIQSGNQNALNAIMQDPKKLKNMAKALNQDWLNPEKTDVYREALKNVMAQHGQKQEAMQGLKGLFSNLLGKNRQLQQQAMGSISPDQRQAMQKEMLAKAPMGQTQDPAMFKDAIALLKDKEEMAFKYAQLATTTAEKDATLKQAKEIHDQTFEMRKMELQYQQGRTETEAKSKEAELKERTRHDIATESIQRQKSKQAGTKVSAAEQDKRDRLAGADKSVSEIVSKYQGKPDTEKIDADDQQLMSGMFNVVSGAGLPKKARTWTEEIFSSGNVMTVGQARKMQKLLQNFKVTPTPGSDSGGDVGFVPDE